LDWAIRMNKPVFLVTGGSRGIGEAIALQASAAGYSVLLTYAGRAEAAESVARRISDKGGEAQAIKADTGQWEDIERMFAASDAMGRLAVLCYNGGVTGGSTTMAEVSNEALHETVNVNLTGAMICSREAILRMSTKRGGQGGSIIFMSSRATFYGSPNDHVWYAASKGGIDSLTYGLAREVGIEGIRVNAVSPGPIRTEIHSPGRLERIESSLPMGRAGEPEEVASAVMFLASEAASYVAGSVLAVGGGR
jgi:NAD(P)-dependent dehydrogenase (short-subunit alcohol dehydrogenase family)